MTTSEVARPTATDIDELKEAVGAPVWRPGEQGYADAVSTWNLGVALKPAAVLVAHTAVDVVAGVRWAARHGVPVGAHATGHGAVANADGALLINTCGL